jgi:CDP-glucose 4,6-dehydratase
VGSGEVGTLFQETFRDRRVLLTGDTGFKGSWLALWLHSLGAKVTGYASYLPSEPCNFQRSRVGEKIHHVEGDVRDFDNLGRVFAAVKPEFVFHLAAQPIVRASYADPKLTFDVNVGGTVNVLECVRLSPDTRAAVFITSDKCYFNNEWPWGYRETDSLGGEDPYSGSKGAAELAIHSYAKSFFLRGGASARIASARAGNVVGGGDWAPNRIVPDAIRAWSEGKPVEIRNPQSTRPWQFVLEPLSGYLALAADLAAGQRLNGEAFNFGPRDGPGASVSEILSLLSREWPGVSWKHVPDATAARESGLLKLSCDKAARDLQWNATLDLEQTAQMTATWYREVLAGADAYATTMRQIREYVGLAEKQNIPWTK